MKGWAGTVVGVVLGAALALGAETLWRHDGRFDGGRGEWRPAATPTGYGPDSRPAIEAGIARCRDDCEQWQIVNQAPESALKSCRAACGTAPAASHEPIRSISTSRTRPSVGGGQ